MIAPEVASSSGPADCFGDESGAYLRELVDGKEIVLEFDVECEDLYSRELAWIFLEGDDGITNATLTVTLSNPVDIPILIDYATANGDHHSNENAGMASSSGPEYAGVNSTADNEDPSDPVGQYDFVNSAKVDGHDYDDTEGILNFTAVNNGLINGSSSQTITVPVYGDEVVELDEWLTVAIGNQH